MTSLFTTTSPARARRARSRRLKPWRAGCHPAVVLSLWGALALPVGAQDLIVEAGNGQDLVATLRAATPGSTVFVPAGEYDITTAEEVQLNPGVTVVGETIVEVDPSGRATGNYVDGSVIMGKGVANGRAWIRLVEGNVVRGITFRGDVQALNVYGAAPGRRVVIEECVFDDIARAVTGWNIADGGTWDIRISRTVTSGGRGFTPFHLVGGNFASGGTGRLEFVGNYVQGSSQIGLALFGGIIGIQGLAPDEPLSSANHNSLYAVVANNTFDGMRTLGVDILGAITQSDTLDGNEASHNAVYFDLLNNTFANFSGVPLVAGMAATQSRPRDRSRQTTIPPAAPTTTR